MFVIKAHTFYICEVKNYYMIAKKAAMHDEEAFCQLWNEYGKYADKYLLNCHSGPFNSDDLLQDIQIELLNFCKNIDRYKALSDRELKSLFKTVIKNQINNAWRKFYSYKEKTEMEQISLYDELSEDCLVIDTLTNHQANNPLEYIIFDCSVEEIKQWSRTRSKHQRVVLNMLADNRSIEDIVVDCRLSRRQVYNAIYQLRQDYKKMNDRC